MDTGDAYRSSTKTSPLPPLANIVGKFNGNGGPHPLALFPPPTSHRLGNCLAHGQFSFVPVPAGPGRTCNSVLARTDRALPGLE
ncbi:MAG: hypothetical protein Q9192_001505 [Flavoplaca navasiana]